MLEVGEAQLRAVLDALPARVALIDPERRHRYVNQEYAAFLGLPPELILGRTVAELLGQAAYAQVEPLGRRAMAGETVRFDGWLGYGHAGPRYVHRVYAPYRDGGGTVAGYFVFSRDLTELKRSEERLAAQLAALHGTEVLTAAITASALDCIVMIDAAGQVVAFNPAAERTFGYREADVLGRPIGDLIVPPHLRARHAAGFARYLATAESHVLGRRIEIEAMRADGTVFPVELTITEVRLPDRHLFTAYLRDLTPAREAAAEIERQRQALHQSEKLAALGAILSGVAHELNNPLSIVISNALMLEEEAEDAGNPALMDRATRLRSAADRCARTVRSFLAMAREARPQHGQVQPAALVQDVLDQFADGLAASGVSVACDVPGTLPDLPGDPDQLHQVVSNLVTNARQAMEGQPGPRRIGIAAWQDGPMVEITVTDSGPGVPAPVQGRIFDPFFTTKPVGAGTGVGLALSRGIVEAHGGTLRHEAPDGGGARFVVRLPAAKRK